MTPQIFHIIGAGRGGTSLLMGLFDAHPGCTMVSEELSVRTLLPQPGETDDLAARTAARIAAFRAACRAAADRSGTPFWGHKATSEQVAALARPSVPNPRQIDPLAEFAAALRDMPVLYVLRDGRSCVASKMARNDQGLDAALHNWKTSVHLLHRLQAAKGPLHVLRFEDLVTRPKRTLRAACGFLGVPWTKDMLAGTASEKMRPEYRRDGFDAAAALPPDPPWAARLEPEQTSAGYAAR